MTDPVILELVCDNYNATTTTPAQHQAEQQLPLEFSRVFSEKQRRENFKKIMVASTLNGAAKHEETLRAT
jgi:hypothetical protein